MKQFLFNLMARLLGYWDYTVVPKGTLAYREHKLRKTTAAYKQGLDVSRVYYDLFVRSSERCERHFKVIRKCADSPRAQRIAEEYLNALKDSGGQNGNK